MDLKTRTFATRALTLLVCLSFLAACGDPDDETNANNQNQVHNQNQTNNVTEAGFDVEIDTTASVLTVDEGESVVVAFVVENTGTEEATATVTFSINSVEDEMEIQVEGGESASGSFTWDTAAGDAGTYTATVSVGDVSDTASVTVNEETEVVGEALFELAIDEENSTLEVDEGELLSIIILATNIGDAEGILELTGTLEADGETIGTLQLEGEGEPTPIPPNQTAQIEAQLPTGAGEQQLPAGQYTLVLNSQHDSASVQLTVN